MIQQEDNKITLAELVDQIEFPKTKKKIILSQTQSISSSHTVDKELKEKSKAWSQEEAELLRILINKYGTDYHILSTFFPRKTKNQIKHKHKEIQVMRKKEEKEEKLKLLAMSILFKQEAAES